MLVGIIGDIHGNIEALQSTLDELDRLHVRNIYCTGDIVGYGAAPHECIRLIQEREIPCACGNHDSYAVRINAIRPENVRKEALEAIRWTRRNLTDTDLDWLDGLPGIYECPDFMLTHASCQPYPQWMYVTSEQAACMHLLFQQKPLCFTGHSHVPVLALHKPGSRVMLDFFQDAILPKDYTIMVGVGSVGQPRDNDWRSCFILYDTEKRLAVMRRVAYDVDKAMKRILDAGLPRFLATRLKQGD